MSADIPPPHPRNPKQGYTVTAQHETGLFPQKKRHYGR
jgi:hypothetical protein